MYRVSRAFPFTEFRGLGMESLMEQHQEGGGGGSDGASLNWNASFSFKVDTVVLFLFVAAATAAPNRRRPSKWPWSAPTATSTPCCAATWNSSPPSRRSAQPSAPYATRSNPIGAQSNQIKLNFIRPTTYPTLSGLVEPYQSLHDPLRTLPGHETRSNSIQLDGKPTQPCRTS